MKINIYDALLWIFFILSIIFFFWYLLGDSPTFEQAILVLILSLLITNTVKTNVLETRFKSLAKDFKVHLKNHK